MDLNILIPFLEKVALPKAEELKKEIESLVKKDETIGEEKKAEIPTFITYWDLLKSKI